MDAELTIDASPQSLFLAHLSETGNVLRSCKHAGISRQTAYNWREDPLFALAWKHALEDASDLLEEEARRRAYHGVDKPVFYQGDECGQIREYSDTLLTLLLKANNPDKFRENVNLQASVDARVAHSGSVHIYVPDNGKQAEGDTE